MQVILTHVLGHAAIGGCFGLSVSLALIVSDLAHIFQMIANASMPQLTALAFVSIFTLLFAAGATLSGLIFEADEGN